MLLQPTRRRPLERIVRQQHNKRTYQRRDGQLGLRSCRIWITTSTAHKHTKQIAKKGYPPRKARTATATIATTPARVARLKNARRNFFSRAITFIAGA